MPSETYRLVQEEVGLIQKEEDHGPAHSRTFKLLQQQLDRLGISFGVSDEKIGLGCFFFFFLTRAEDMTDLRLLLDGTEKETVRRLLVGVEKKGRNCICEGMKLSFKGGSTGHTNLSGVLPFVF